MKVINISFFITLAFGLVPEKIASGQKSAIFKSPEKYEPKIIFQDLIELAFKFKGTQYGKVAMTKVLDQFLKENLKKSAKNSGTIVDPHWKQIIFWTTE